ncbi:galactosyltransferase-related protein [Oscillatoria sp. FACHB-1407]|uniref:galactosyltransferase-related protein n=1 Tax=Oscillatoria sp. FACHB-1407 TaxID=2692847 RepID=UPI0018EF66ED|nr:galactosyltransferase-related protein [Oscillatoria sp. FACHB-1407]
MTIKLSLLVTYRRRKSHLETQLNWWRAHPELAQFCELVLVEVDETPSLWIQTAIRNISVNYHFCEGSGVFHKTKALNVGLSMAQGKWIAPFDVDLIPVGDSLTCHLRIAANSPSLLVTGYRVMSTSEMINVQELDAELVQAAIAPEDMPTALWKHLIRGERFGVVPFFQRDRLLQIGGWDEAFVGWGGEDQDVIERYLERDCHLCRCPELVYLHLWHDRDPHWTEPNLIEQNRQYYYANRHS